MIHLYSERNSSSKLRSCRQSDKYLQSAILLCSKDIKICYLFVDPEGYASGGFESGPGAGAENFTSSSSIKSRIRVVKLSTSSSVSSDVSTGARTANVSSVSSRRLNHLKRGQLENSFGTFNHYFPTLKPPILSIHNVSVVHYDNGDNWNLGLHREMECSFLEFQEIRLFETRSFPFGEYQDVCLYFSNCSASNFLKDGGI